MNKETAEEIYYMNNVNFENSFELYDTILDLIRKNRNLQSQLDKKEAIIKEAIERLNHEWYMRKQLGITDKSFQEWELKDILSILEKGDKLC